MKYVCPCGYEYDPAKGDPDNGIAPGTAWEDLPEDFVCPTCGLDKMEVSVMELYYSAKYCFCEYEKGVVCGKVADNPIVTIRDKYIWQGQIQ